MRTKPSRQYGRDGVRDGSSRSPNVGRSDGADTGRRPNLGESSLRLSRSGFNQFQPFSTTVDRPSLTLASQVRHGARICKRLGAVVFLIVAISGCVVAFVLMIIWVSLYWLLTHLLFKTATLLRVVYDEPTVTDRRRDSAKDLSTPDEHKSETGSENL